jgi:hypothetical protein
MSDPCAVNGHVANSGFFHAEPSFHLLQQIPVAASASSPSLACWTVLVYQRVKVEIRSWRADISSQGQVGDLAVHE